MIAAYKIRLMLKTGCRTVEAGGANIRGLGAILVKATSIVNYRLVTEKMAEAFMQLGGDVKIGTEVVGLEETPSSITLTCQQKNQRVSYQAKFLVTCSGLMADRLTKMLGLPTDFQIILIVANTIVWHQA